MIARERCIALFFLLWFIPGLMLRAQTVIAFQGGEGTAADNWGFVPITNAGGAIPPGIVGTAARTGSFAIRAAGGSNIGCTSGTNCITGGANSSTGCAMHGTAVQFNPVNVACLDGVQLSVYHRSQPSACSGAGFDASDNLNFEVRLDGGAWMTIQTMATSSDYLWTYATNPAGVPATVPNPWTYTVPSGTNSFEFRVRAVVNRSDEVFYLDDVTLTTTTTAYGIPGTAGLWNGLVSTNWFNPCNWDSRSVPTAGTNVTFPTAATNDIVIQSLQNCVCNNLTCSGGAGRSINATGSPDKMLTVFGNLTNNTSAGSTVLRFDDGSAGTPDGVINLYGNWTNNSSAADFVEGESTVNFLGSANQTISLATVEPSENFGNVTVNKPSGDVVLAKSIQVGSLLTLTNGKITTAANAVGVANPLPASVMGHSTASYVNGNLVRAILAIPGTRTYDFPLGTASNYELASLTLNNPAGITVIGGFFNPFITGTPPSITESSNLYNAMLDAGIWDLAPDAPYIGSYDITLVERGYSNGGAASYIDVKRPDAVSLWSNPGTHVSFSEVGSVVTCTRSGLTSFSEFGIARNILVLAMDGLSLNASPKTDGQVAVRWRWVDDKLQGHFDLKREHDGQVQDLGTWEIGSTQIIQMLDKDAPVGYIRYKLYYTGVDGARSEAATTDVWNTADPHARPLLWPNPSDGKVHLQLSAEHDWRLELVRIDGAQLGIWRGDAVTLQGQFEQFVASLPSGVYLLNCLGNGENYHLKMVIR